MFSMIERDLTTVERAQMSGERRISQEEVDQLSEESSHFLVLETPTSQKQMDKLRAEKDQLLGERKEWRRERDKFFVESKAWRKEKTAIVQQVESLREERNQLLAERKELRRERHQLFVERKEWRRERQEMVQGIESKPDGEVFIALLGKFPSYSRRT